jgi:hypothetical protein
MKNKMSSAAKSPVIELAPHLQSSRKAPRRNFSAGTVIPLRPVSPDPAPVVEQAPSETVQPVRRGPGRMLGFLRRLIARIDLKDFPGSCCG